MTTVLPTHTCFDDALEIIESIIKAHPDAAHTDEFVLVHAIVHPEGEDFAHAWVESREGIVFWKGIVDGEKVILGSPSLEFRSGWKPVEWTAYTPREAAEQNARWGTFGPWEMKYLRLCRDYKGDVGCAK